jgi:hypothetical protein
MLKSSMKSALYGILAAILTVYCAYSVYQALSTGMTHLPIRGFSSISIAKATDSQPFWLAVIVYIAGAAVSASLSIRCIVASLTDEDTKA